MTFFFLSPLLLFLFSFLLVDTRCFFFKGGATGKLKN